MDKKNHEARKSFLAEVFGARGHFAETDIISGEDYQSITPADLMDFLDAHLFGQERRKMERKRW